MPSSSHSGLPRACCPPPCCKRNNGFPRQSCSDPQFCQGHGCFEQDRPDRRSPPGALRLPSPAKAWIPPAAPLVELQASSHGWMTGGRSASRAKPVRAACVSWRLQCDQALLYYSITVLKAQCKLLQQAIAEHFAVHEDLQADLQAATHHTGCGSKDSHADAGAAAQPLIRDSSSGSCLPGLIRSSGSQAERARTAAALEGRQLPAACRTLHGRCLLHEGEPGYQSSATTAARAWKV
jgi:hypothetical protein